MTIENIETQVKQIVAEQLNVELSELDNSKSFLNDSAPTRWTSSSWSWPWKRSSTSRSGRGRREDPDRRRRDQVHRRELLIPPPRANAREPTAAASWSLAWDGHAPGDGCGNELARVAGGALRRRPHHRFDTTNHSVKIAAEVKDLTRRTSSEKRNSGRWTASSITRSPRPRWRWRTRAWRSPRTSPRAWVSWWAPAWEASKRWRSPTASAWRKDPAHLALFIRGSSRTWRRARSRSFWARRARTPAPSRPAPREPTRSAMRSRSSSGGRGRHVRRRNRGHDHLDGHRRVQLDAGPLAAQR